MSRNQTSVFIHAQKLMMESMCLTNAELGGMITKLCVDCRERNWQEVKKLAFVTRLIKGISKRPHIPLDVRRRVLSVGHCVKCKSTEKLVVNHVIPFSLGGSHDESNFQCLCRFCNTKKSNRIEA